jgi:hypothetical protein
MLVVQYCMKLEARAWESLLAVAAATNGCIAVMHCLHLSQLESTGGGVGATGMGRHVGRVSQLSIPPEQRHTRMVASLLQNSLALQSESRRHVLFTAADARQQLQQETTCRM